MRKSSVPVVVAVAVLAGLAGCGGGSGSPSAPGTPAVTPAPTPTPTPVATQPAACLLKAPTADCANRPQVSAELAPPLQEALDAAAGTPGVMYPDLNNQIYDIMKFRTKVVETLSNQNICGAWDYGDPAATELFVRSADGCKVEQYAVIASNGGVRPASQRNLMWEGDFSSPVPQPKPTYAKEGDLSCPLPGDRATYCFSIRNSPGVYGEDVYRLMTQVLAENPSLFDPNYYLPGTGMDPSSLKLPGWYIKDVPQYVAAVEAKLRANGYCAYVDEVLRVKSVAKGNVFHEEIDIIQNPPGGGDFTLFSVHDRCHDAGF